MIAVIEKCFAILETMTAEGGMVSLKFLADATKMPKATLHRILQTMAELGYVEQDAGRGTYGLTVQLAHLGSSRRLDGITERALPLMEQLHRRFNETVNLGVLQGAYVHYVHFLETTQNLRAQVHPSARDPFHSTALGRAIVAHLPAEEQEKLLQRSELSARTPATVTSRRKLRSILRQTRARGWALDQEENDVGIVCIGIPLLEGERPVASISLSVPTSRLPPARRQEIVAALLQIGPGP
jgi:DNA-binding IclR family transcriptional regulator